MTLLPKPSGTLQNWQLFPGPPKRFVETQFKPCQISVTVRCPSSALFKTESNPKTPYLCATHAQGDSGYANKTWYFKPWIFSLGFQFFSCGTSRSRTCLQQVLSEPSGTLILEKKPYLAEHALLKPSPEPIPKQSAFQKTASGSL